MSDKQGSPGLTQCGFCAEDYWQRDDNTLTLEPASPTHQDKQIHLNKMIDDWFYGQKVAECKAMGVTPPPREEEMIEVCTPCPKLRSEPTSSPPRPVVLVPVQPESFFQRIRRTCAIIDHVKMISFDNRSGPLIIGM